MYRSHRCPEQEGPKELYKPNAITSKVAAVSSGQREWIVSAPLTFIKGVLKVTFENSGLRTHGSKASLER